MILLNALRDRMEFPELKKVALAQYKAWLPDSVIIEKKASGAPLIYELRSMGIPVQEFSPTRATGDKIARLNAVADRVRVQAHLGSGHALGRGGAIQRVVDFPSGRDTTTTWTLQ